MPAARVLDPAPSGGQVLRWVRHGQASRTGSCLRSPPCRPPAAVLGQQHGWQLWLSEECWCRGLIRLAALLDDLLSERKAEQPEPPVDPELEVLLPF